MYLLYSPGLTLIKKAGKNICLVNFELGGLLDLVLIEHTSSQSFQSLTCLADPGVDLFVKGAIVRNDISEVHEFLPDFSSVHSMVCCGRVRHFCFPNADSKEKQMGCFSKLVDNELEGKFHVSHESTIIGKEDLQDEFLNHLSCHTEVTEVKERPVQSTHDVHAMSLTALMLKIRQLMMHAKILPAINRKDMPL